MSAIVGFATGVDKVLVVVTYTYWPCVPLATAVNLL